MFGSSFESRLNNLVNVLQRCVESDLFLSFEKCPFLVREGIVSRHIISDRGIQVDKSNVDVISYFPYPTSVRGEIFSWSCWFLLPLY